MPRTNYTAKDFERYHSGKMSNGEMHELEKAALQDAFLADALEGYLNTKTPQKDVAELREKLLSNKKKKIFFINRKENLWLRIAALFILVAGIGYLAYFINFKNENNTLAKNESRNELKTVTAPKSIPEKGSGKNFEKENTAFEPAKKKENKINPPKRQTALQLNKTSDNNVERSTYSSDKENLQKPMQLEAQRDMVDFSDKRNILKGRVQDSWGNAISAASIMNKNRQVATTSDSAGRFKLSAKDSSLTATVAAVGYKSKEIKLSNQSDEVIVLQADKNNLAEVVVTGAGMQKQKREVSVQKQLEGKVAGVSVNNSTSKPVSGKGNFDEYIRQNISIPKNDSGENYKGKVILSFDVNKKGNPKNIKTDQSLCDECDKEAIRLLVKGPKWKYIKNKRQTVTIEF